jgi:putative Holliday junction resolvase
MYLGIDWGEKKIGLAIADEETKLAFAQEIIFNDYDVFNNLEKVINEHSIQKIIIGITQQETQTDNQIKIKAFAQELENRFELFIDFAEEMFSTREAQENLKSQNLKQIDKKDDAESARILLQSYLDNRGY